MKDEDKIKDKLLKEMEELRQQVSESIKEKKQAISGIPKWFVTYMTIILGIIASSLISLFIFYLGPIKYNAQFIPSIKEKIISIEGNTEGISSIKEKIISIEGNTEGISSIKEKIISIEGNTEGISSISISIARIEENTKHLPLIRDDVKYLREQEEEKKMLITPQKGGKLEALDWYTTINIKPNAVSEEIWFKYKPLTTEELPPGLLPPLIKPVGYNFALTPYSLTGLKLPGLSFKEPVEVSIAYTNFNLDLTTNKLTDLMLERWDDKQRKWIPVETTVNGKILHAEITQPGYFVLGFHTPENS